MPAIAVIPQATLNTIALRANYTFNVNPRQVLINNIGIDGFEGGGNLWAGDSAADLDDLSAHLAVEPRAVVTLDVGALSAEWRPCGVADVARLRAAFFALYGLGKPNYYGPEGGAYGNP